MLSGWRWHRAHSLPPAQARIEHPLEHAKDPAVDHKKNIATEPHSGDSGMATFIYCIYNKTMSVRLVWDEAKRAANLAKHGLDFAQARAVLESRYRLDVPVVRNGERRVQSIAYVFEHLAVLTVVHTDRNGAARIISFRRASQLERETYYAWLQEL